MSNRYILTSILMMAVVTYLIRMLPMAIFGKRSKTVLFSLFKLCALLCAGGHDLSGHFFRHRDAAQRLRGNCDGRGNGLILIRDF